MSQPYRIRILSPEGEILKALLKEPKTPVQLLKEITIGRTTLYENLKDLMLAEYIERFTENNIYKVTKAGIRAFWSEVLPDEVDVGRLLRVSEELRVSSSKIIELGVRLIVDIIEHGRVPSDLGYLLAGYDPGLLDDILSIIRRDEGGTQARQQR